jgi:feruloyl esterase
MDGGGNQESNTTDSSLLRHPGLAQTGEISGLEEGADLRHPEIPNGPQTGEARITTIAVQPAGFGEFRGGALGLLFEGIGGGEVSGRKAMRGFAHALIVAIPALVGGASAVHASSTACRSTLTGTIGNVVVPNGAFCTLSDATVLGNVLVLQNASLTVDATEQPTTIDGNVEADRCAFALLEGGVTVTGNVRIGQCAQPSGFVGPGIKIGGSFACVNDLGACKADLGDVSGDLQVEGDNSAASADISLVSVGGDLQCQGNSPAPAHAFGPDFVDGKLQGQCAARLGFAPSTAAPSCTTSTFNVPNLTVASATYVTPPKACFVTGAVATRGEGYGPGSAEFGVVLPVHWNGHFLFFGCGGTCGSLGVSVNQVDVNEATPLGYAVVATDAGHEQDPTTTDLTWAVSETGVVNEPAIIDYYYRAVHQVTVATKQYIEAYYRQPIDHAYFDGCSNAGRQSLMEGEHYPVDYDGLIAGDADSMAFGRNTHFKQAKAFIPTLAYIPYAKLAQVDSAVKASCDALDGVKDGLIQNPAQCSLVPSTLVSRGILTASQAAALQSYISPKTDQFGAPVAPGMSISDLSTAGFEGDDEIATPAPDPTAAEPWGAKGVGPYAWTLADNGTRAFLEENQSFDVNTDRLGKVSAAGEVVSDATLALVRQREGAAESDYPFKLANFLNKGGKVILYHGGSDPVGSPFRSIWFYEELAALDGSYRQTQDSARLFIVPGMGHCGGGAGPNSFDTLQALDNWVGNGVAPEGIVATAPNGRTMPLCKFPEEARYSGSGNVNLATSWTCNANDQRMLEVGKDGKTAGADTATALQYLYEAEPVGLGGP